jgi:hypothetical protein
LRDWQPYPERNGSQFTNAPDPHSRSYSNPDANRLANRGSDRGSDRVQPAARLGGVLRSAWGYAFCNLLWGGYYGSTNCGQKLSAFFDDLSRTAVVCAALSTRPGSNHHPSDRDPVYPAHAARPDAAAAPDQYAPANPAAYTYTCPDGSTNRAAYTAVHPSGYAGPNQPAVDFFTNALIAADQYSGLYGHTGGRFVRSSEPGWPDSCISIGINFVGLDA